MKIRGAIQVMLISVIVSYFGTGCAKSPQVTDVPSGPADPEDPTPRIKAFGKSVWWEPAMTGGRERMRARALEDGTSYDGIYMAMWDVNREPVLVVLKQSPGDLFGAIWDVEAYSADGRRVATGTICCQQYERPFCLVEVKSSHLPPKYRDQWILGIGMLDTTTPYWPDAPIKFVGMPMDDGEDAAGRLAVEPVRWGEDDRAQFRDIGVGALYDLEEGRQIRSAESVLKLPATRPSTFPTTT